MENQQLTLFDFENTDCEQSESDRIYNLLTKIQEKASIPEREKNDITISTLKSGDINYSVFGSIWVKIIKTASYPLIELKLIRSADLLEKNELACTYGKGVIRIKYSDFMSHFNSIETYLNELYLSLRDTQQVRISFGCCHLYEQCSNAMKCINPDLSFAVGCEYKKNLEKGKIFYGINSTKK